MNGTTSHNLTFSQSAAKAVSHPISMPGKSYPGGVKASPTSALDVDAHSVPSFGSSDSLAVSETSTASDSAAKAARVKHAVARRAALIEHVDAAITRHGLTLFSNPKQQEHWRNSIARQPSLIERAARGNHIDLIVDVAETITNDGMQRIMQSASEAAVHARRTYYDAARRYRASAFEEHPDRMRAMLGFNRKAGGDVSHLYSALQAFYKPPSASETAEMENLRVRVLQLAVADHPGNAAARLRGSELLPSRVVHALDALDVTAPTRLQSAQAARLLQSMVANESDVCDAQHGYKARPLHGGVAFVVSKIASNMALTSLLNIDHFVATLCLALRTPHA